MPDNYAITLLNIREKYHKMYPGEPEEAEGWIFNDILSFMNNHHPSIVRFSPNFIAFINRGEQTKIQNINLYLEKLNDLTCDAAILKLWDKMLPHERDTFVSN